MRVQIVKDAKGKNEACMGMRKLSAFWLAVILACITETVFRTIGHYVGDASPEGGGSGIALLLVFLHLPAIFITAILIHNVESPLWFQCEVGASIVVFTLFFWSIIKIWRWHKGRHDT